MSAPDFHRVDGEAPQLVLQGDWTIATIGSVEEKLRDFVSNGGLDNVEHLAAGELGQLDTAGAFIIDRSFRTISDREPLVLNAPDRVLALLSQARAVALSCEEPDQIKDAPHGFVDMLERTGRGAEHVWKETLETLSFMGGVLVSVSRVVTQPGKMRWTALVSVMEESGLDAVPIVAFLSFFVGMVVAFIGATSLAQLGATIFVVELVGIGHLRELGGVLVAVIIAGRTNSAFTAQIGAMKMRQEIDAMQTLGLDPMDVIVAPRVIAMVLMLPVLTFIGMVSGLAGGVIVSWLALDINPTVFFNRLQDFVPMENFWIGMSKAPVFGLAIALIGCRQGLEVGGSVQSLGEHTTKSVVQSIFAIIVIDALFAIFYMELGL
ncbi:MAG: ABC transporter permease [Henriciella sp.]|nr:ABC transporter permease [Henriciella sp.]